MKAVKMHNITAPCGTLTGAATVIEATVEQSVQTMTDTVLFWVTTAATLICACATICSAAIALYKKIKEQFEKKEDDGK